LGNLENLFFGSSTKVLVRWKGEGREKISRVDSERKGQGKPHGDGHEILNHEPRRDSKVGHGQGNKSGKRGGGDTPQTEKKERGKRDRETD